MNPIRTILALAVTAACVSAVIAGPAGPAAAEVTVKGDAEAWQEVVAAYRKLNALPGYRMKLVPAGGQTMVVEVAQGGNAMHATIQTSNGTMEMVRIGDDLRDRRVEAGGATAGWECSGIPPIPRASDPTTVQGAVEIARTPDATVDGQQMRVYFYTVEAPAGGGVAGTYKTTLYVGAESGLPRRVVLATSRGDQALDFYDYGAQIQITLPPCRGASPIPSGLDSRRT